MTLPTTEMSFLKDCNGYIWQVVDRYWRSTRKYERMTFYVIDAPYTNGPTDFERNFGPLTVLEVGREA